jgi:hypothetical protein
MTDRSHKEDDIHLLVRVVSACTLGLWAFSEGLLIGVFCFPDPWPETHNAASGTLRLAALALSGQRNPPATGHICLNQVWLCPYRSRTIWSVFRA